MPRRFRYAEGVFLIQPRVAVRGYPGTLPPEFPTLKALNPQKRMTPQRELLASRQMNDDAPFFVPLCESFPSSGFGNCLGFKSQPRGPQALLGCQIGKLLPPMDFIEKIGQIPARPVL